MSFTGPVEDMRIIRELHERYSDAVVRQDVQAYLDCWAADGQRTGSGGECRGHADLAAHFTGVFQALEQMAYFIQLASIAVDGSNATARSYTLEFVKPRDGLGFQVVGEYTDELTALAGGWVFSRRNYRVVMAP